MGVSILYVGVSVLQVGVLIPSILHVGVSILQVGVSRLQYVPVLVSPLLTEACQSSYHDH